MEAKVSMEELSSSSQTVSMKDYLRAHDGKPLEIRRDVRRSAGLAHNVMYRQFKR